MPTFNQLVRKGRRGHGDLQIQLPPPCSTVCNTQKKQGHRPCTSPQKRGVCTAVRTIHPEEAELCSA